MKPMMRLNTVLTTLGLSSAIAVPGILGIPVTQKGVSTSFTVVSGHVPPGEEGAADWPNLPRLNSTLVILMGVRNLEKICSYLLSCEWKSAMPVALIQSGTTNNEKLVICDLTTAPDAAKKMELASPAIIIVGEVARCLPKAEIINRIGNKSKPQVWGVARDPV